MSNENRQPFRRVLLRDTGPHDLESIEAWGRAIDYERYMSRLSPLCFDGSFESRNVDFVWYVIALEDGCEVGTVWLERKPFQKGIGVLGILIGDNRLFDRGIGRAAVRRTIGLAARKLGVTLIRLHVRRSNLRAIACYRRCGFSITGSARATIADGRRIPFHRMELDLATAAVPLARSRTSRLVDLPRVSGK